MTRRTEDGAPKCDLRDFLREEWRASRIAISILYVDPIEVPSQTYRCLSSSS